MKICTFNVNSIRARQELVLEWLSHRGYDIDILCLQELKTEDTSFPAAEFEGIGYRCHVFGQKAYNGVAILTKSKPDKVEKGFAHPAWDEQRRFLSVRTEGIHVLNVYAPHGDVRGTEKFLYKLKWYEHLVSFLSQKFAPQDPVLIVGDFNVAHQAIDVYSPEALADTIGTMPEERAAFKSLLDWGLVDVFRRLYPERRQFTWWDYIGGAIWKDQGMRLDYILATQRLLRRIQAVEVDLWPRKRQKPTPSDHAPVIAEVDLG